MEMRKGSTGHYKLRDHAHPKNRDYWPTPRATHFHNEDAEKRRAREARGHVYSLPLGVVVNMWPTPTVAGDYNPALNPEWVEWLMGWPIGWTSLEPMPLSHFQAWLDAVRDCSYWDADPADCPESGIKRTAPPGIPHWAARLIAIGNGQVPACAATAWKALRGERGTDANKT